MARHIQRFLERYRPAARQQHLKIFLDVTDIRSGELGRTLRDELVGSSKLIVCASRASADSRWVDKEFAIFRTTQGDANIGVVLLNGEPDQVVPPAGDGGIYRWHDVRRAIAFLPFGNARLEMLRLLAFVAEVDLRKIVNWRRRRIAARLAVALPVIAGTLVSIALFPVTTWQPLQLGELNFPPRRINPIACELQDDGRLWSAARVQQDYALGPRDYIVQFDNSLAPNPVKIDTWVRRPVAPYRLKHRLLPVTLVDEGLRSTAKLALEDLPAGRERSGEPFVSEVGRGPIVIVQRLSQSSQELASFQDMDEHREVLPGWGSYIVVDMGGQRRAAVVEGFVPKWEAYFPRNDHADPKSSPSSPSRGIAAAWDGGVRIWLGVGSWDNRAPGGLWSSDDMGATWSRDPHVSSASDVAFVPVTTGSELLLAQSAYEDWWTSIVRNSFPPRLRRRALASADWREDRAPPHGQQSEMEICGVLNTSLIVRVDQTIYKRTEQPLWRGLRDIGFW